MRRRSMMEKPNQPGERGRGERQGIQYYAQEKYGSYTRLWVMGWVDLEVW